MYSVLPSYLLGFHGCDKKIADRVLLGRLHLRRSSNDYDWLGEGIYFWENSPTRALQYAAELMSHPRRNGPRVHNSAVVGAVIEVGYCLNLLDAEFLSVLKESYSLLRSLHQQLNLPLPQNMSVADELLLRPLDCAVINHLHEVRTSTGLRPFDTVRSAFAEGGELYPGSGISAKHHIQLCVRRRSCIKGYFHPMKEAELPAD